MFMLGLVMRSTHGVMMNSSIHMCPFFSRHQAKVDLLVGFAHGEMVRIVDRNQAEIEFAKSTLKVYRAIVFFLKQLIIFERESGESGEHN
ncbi:HVA22-like protein k [Euphorbia lathyris]|uniref:HVA22-like protein k n=1 Tax=Euphorbia lathyris TaxID=212925 RepID=UPI0033141241